MVPEEKLGIAILTNAETARRWRCTTASSTIT
jgi:hypothetical protein